MFSVPLRSSFENGNYGPRAFELGLVDFEFVKLESLMVLFLSSRCRCRANDSQVSLSDSLGGGFSCGRNGGNR